ncbi:hypothetical protein [Sphingosinicella humi]|uniref:Uncharacterized protein n=1 Tax=Allosphingosinicella humi TaxID=2068657 RepID=A0A2U2J442_9SPHN|nr:hypothetical protein [Sphingosinicella humi]PWG03116.1 hypothetical protein DF286_09750 [Sphingosinicella humi]
MGWTAPLALLVLLLTAGEAAAGTRGEDAPECAALREAILGHRLTPQSFETFWSIATYREAKNLEILPGYPHCTKTDEAVSTLGADAETGVRLLAGGMTPADYIVTGWVIVTAYDPSRSGLRDAAEESPSAQANIAFVKERRGRVRRMFRR